MAATPQSDDGTVGTIARELERRIITGEYSAGQRLRQEALAAEFGVSRTPIREALRTLEAATFLQMVPRRGAIVRLPSPREIRDAYAVRAELEAFAAQLAAVYITTNELRELHTAARLFDNSVRQIQPGADSNPGQASPWIEANERFHACILSASRNNALQRLTNTLHSSFPRSLTWPALHEDQRLLHRNIEEHQAITNALEAGDPPLARSLMADHVRHAGDLVAMWTERHS